MYTRHFGLKQEPFSLAPDPRYLFMSERHREALAHLLYGVRAGSGGFVLLTGEIGAGKTTVARCLLEQIPEGCNVGYIFNPKLTVEELLRSICDEFRIALDDVAAQSATVKDYVDALNDFLLKTHAQGQANVLIIDEAQNLSVDVLEQLRLLTNLETNERKLLQIILIGQPELRTMLARPELEQLAQRIIARYHLEPLTQGETAYYLRHRLAVGGMTGVIPFDREARHRIHELTGGIPRRINLLADRALLGAYSRELPRATREIVDQAAREVFHPSSPAKQMSAPWRPYALAAAAVTAAVILLGAGWVLRDRMSAGQSASTPAPATQATTSPAPAPTPTEAQRPPSPSESAGSAAAGTTAAATQP
jgi:general secretion pathway protein A